MKGVHEYLGLAIGDLLRDPPWSEWRAVRTVHGKPIYQIWYEFDGHGVDVICDTLDRVQSVFINKGEGEALAGIPFAWGRKQVLEHFGEPAKSGGASWVPKLGTSGAWDRFLIPNGSIHIRYCLDCDEIDRVTFMRSDAVP